MLVKQRNKGEVNHLLLALNSWHKNRVTMIQANFANELLHRFEPPPIKRTPGYAIVYVKLGEAPIQNI
jgi:hypothetical protein